MAAATPALRAPGLHERGDVLASPRGGADLEAIGAERAASRRRRGHQGAGQHHGEGDGGGEPGRARGAVRAGAREVRRGQAAVARNVRAGRTCWAARAEREAFARAYDADGWRAAAPSTLRRRGTLAHYRELASGIERGTTFYAGFAAATRSCWRKRRPGWRAGGARRRSSKPRWRRERRRRRQWREPRGGRRRAPRGGGSGRGGARHGRGAAGKPPRRRALYDPYAPPTHAPVPPPASADAGTRRRRRRRRRASSTRRSRSRRSRRSRRRRRRARTCTPPTPTASSRPRLRTGTGERHVTNVVTLHESCALVVRSRRR